VGKRNPGKGQRRVYPDTAVQDALILNTMMEAGVLVEDRQTVMKKVQEKRQQKEDLWPRMKEKKPNLLSLAIETYSWGTKRYFHEGPYTTHPDAERTIVFNLTRFFSVLQNTKQEV